MPITFHCPQGHRLSCADELAGKPGKCPKCGVVVRVPPIGASVATATAPGRAGAAPDMSAVAANEIEAAGDDVTGSDLGADQIIFLCPNGHRLHGSATLAGRPGQCPHCGIRFLVPSPDEEEDEEQVLEDNSPDVRFDDIVIQIDTSGKGGSSKAGKSGAGKSGAGKSGAGKSSEASGLQLPAAAPAIASLLEQLWRYKAQGASVEIHLGDGKMLEPDQVSLKDAHHALFATREANGSQTVTAVSWSAIERIVVRSLEQLPKEWF